jgi:hypothetical protein
MVVTAGCRLNETRFQPVYRLMLCTFRVKMAVTDLAALIVTTQVPVPVQSSPLQPVKLEVSPAAAVSVTTVLLAKLAEQVAPQSIPAGALVTVPEPVPVFETTRAYVMGVKVALGVDVLDAVAVGVKVFVAVAVGVWVLVDVAVGV